MLQQTVSYDQFTRFPKTVKSVAGLFASNNDLKTVTSSPAIKRVISVTNATSEPSLKSLTCDL